MLNICEVVNDVNKISNQTFMHENINYVDKSIEMNKSFSSQNYLLFRGIEQKQFVERQFVLWHHHHYVHFR